METTERDYVHLFNPEEYLKLFFRTPSGDPSPNELGTGKFELNSCHSFYSNYHSQWDNNSAKVLEFGGGPVISRLISGAPFVKEVVFAAYLEDERQEVHKWRDSEEDSHKWDSFFQYVVNTLEHKEEESSWKERDSLLRDRMKEIIACDITKDVPLLDYGVCKEEFDIIQTSYCLEIVCKTYEEYKSAVRKLAFMLKKGGYLVMIAVAEETFYCVGQRKWFCLHLTSSQIEEAFQEAGLKILERDSYPAPEKDKIALISDYKAVLYFAAQK